MLVSYIIFWFWYIFLGYILREFWIVVQWSKMNFSLLHCFYFQCKTVSCNMEKNFSAFSDISFLSESQHKHVIELFLNLQRRTNDLMFIYRMLHATEIMSWMYKFFKTSGMIGQLVRITVGAAASFIYCINLFFPILLAVISR